MKPKHYHVISHQLHLSSADRRTLQHPDREIVASGVSVPVKVNEDATTDEPAPEVFCVYRVSTEEPVEGNVEMTRDGYKIYIPKAVRWKLLDVPEGGSEYLAWTEIGKLAGTTAMHQITVSSAEVLSKSMFSDHLAQTVLK